MQVNNIEQATIIEFKWDCGCRHIIEKSELGQFRDKECCGNPEHKKLDLRKAKRFLYC